MSLRIRRLQLEVATEIGRFGLDLDFTDGLNVIAAPNTSGKSTAMISILYALGLEGMLGATQQAPLTDAMCRSIMHEDREYSVVESKVRLEIENKSNQRITIERSVTGENLDRQLIRGLLGPALSSPAEYPRRDFYVRTGGAAQAESGFHRYLAEFIGYQLPKLPGTDRESIPLYLECLFPYFFVDQMSGWRDIKARMPTYLRIPEMAKRSAEFILDLDILHMAIEKQELQQKEAMIKENWKKTIENVKGVLGKYQVIVRGLPEDPVAIMPVQGIIQMFATDGGEYVLLKKQMEDLKERKETLSNEEIPRAEEVSQSVIAKLQKTEESLVRAGEKLEHETQNLMGERSHRESVWKRLRALTEDLAKYQNAKKLQDRGGLIPLEIPKGLCPTCHQLIKDSLLPQAKSSSPMSLEENMVFIRDQISTFQDMLQDLDEVIEAKDNQINAIVQRITDLNADIKAQKRTLHTDGRVPSVAAVREQLKVESQLMRLEMAAEIGKEIVGRFKELSEEWAEVQGRLKTIAKVGLSPSDESKLDLLGQTFISQLRDYGFSSFPVDQIKISKESYRPSRDEYDVGLTSASDAIRIIWAYLLGLLEAARSKPTNHLGLLILDEPRQQLARQMSFEALMKRTGQTREFNQQVIVSTSEEKSLLEGFLKDVECHYMPFDGKMIRLLPDADNQIVSSGNEPQPSKMLDQ